MVLVTNDSTESTAIQTFDIKIRAPELGDLSSLSHATNRYFCLTAKLSNCRGHKILTQLLTNFAHSLSLSLKLNAALPQLSLTSSFLFPFRGNRDYKNFLITSYLLSLISFTYLRAEETDMDSLTEANFGNDNNVLLTCNDITGGGFCQNFFEPRSNLFLMTNNTLRNIHGKIHCAL